MKSGRVHPVRWLLFLLLLIFQNTMLLGQNDQGNLKPRIAVEAGINLSNMNFNMGEPPPPAPIPASWKTGFQAGLSLTIPFSDKFSFRPEYFYVLRNGSDASTGTEYRFSYFSMPLLLEFRPSPRFGLFAGPQFEILIDANSSKNGSSADITHDVEERNIGVNAGAEWDIYQGFFLTLSYFQGLNHIGIGQRSDLKEFKYQIFTLTGGFRF